ncbi:uncharacterized protein LOC121777602 [Salvia splendens]|uniref:uncharacterized protein LOC121777602 n=1 Tax=Salvia splendens TaxID=180675 RepID=UPI001C251693|nr:uncharacterized protein LOC121777602 [Salvia splendens]
MQVFTKNRCLLFISLALRSMSNAPLGRDYTSHFSISATFLMSLIPILLYMLRWMPIVSTLKRREMRRAPKCAHENLKLVEIGGYYGRTSDAEVAIYFVENTVALQKIVIDPRNQVQNRFPLGDAQIKHHESARKHAREHLKSKIPPQLELVIL